jgi:hypothetical protein
MILRQEPLNESRRIKKIRTLFAKIDAFSTIIINIGIYKYNDLVK